MFEASSENFVKMFSIAKSLVLISALAFVQVDSVRITIEQMQQAAEPVKMVCLQKTKVSEELVENLRAGKLDDQKELKCYVNCVMEMMQTVRVVNSTCLQAQPHANTFAINR